MNKQRRKALDAIMGKIDEAKAELENLRDEEQEYFDNMPQSFQQGDKGQKAESAISYMEDAISELESAYSNIENAKEGN